MSKRTMIKIDAGKTRFNFRVAGLALRDGHVLVHRATHEKFWTFPGGRAEIGETSVETLTREMREELGVAVNVGPLLWAVENFFTFEKRDWHELGYYYRMTVPSSFPFASGSIIHTVEDGHSSLEFKWVPATVATLKSLPLQPNFISDRIENLPGTGEHLIWHETVPE
jgi:8-oxo-dGTP pyrophosphatase MutT (NUDIX family)